MRSLLAGAHRVAEKLMSGIGLVRGRHGDTDTFRLPSPLLLFRLSSDKHDHLGARAGGRG